MLQEIIQAKMHSVYTSKWKEIQPYKPNELLLFVLPKKKWKITCNFQEGRKFWTLSQVYVINRYNVSIELICFLSMNFCDIGTWICTNSLCLPCQKQTTCIYIDLLVNTSTSTTLRYNNNQSWCLDPASFDLWSDVVGSLSFPSVAMPLNLA